MRIFPFMKCVARAVLHEGIEKLGKLAAEFVPFGGYALEFVAGVAKQTIEEMRREHVQPRLAVEEQAAADDADARASAEAVVIEVAPQLPAPQRKQLVEYLTQLPHTLRATLKRPDDPEGKTVPADWDFSDPPTLALALPAGLPRFSPATTPRSRAGSSSASSGAAAWARSGSASTTSTRTSSPPSSSASTRWRRSRSSNARALSSITSSA